MARARAQPIQFNDSNEIDGRALIPNKQESNFFESDQTLALDTANAKANKSGVGGHHSLNARNHSQEFVNADGGLASAQTNTISHE